jgi:sodium transport system permease protein
MVFSLILPGLIIFVLYSVMGNMTSRLTSIDEDYTYQVYVMNQPDELSSINISEGYEIDMTIANLDQDVILKKLEEKEIDLYIIYEEDFYQKMMDYDVSDGQAPFIEMYYNSTSNESSEIYQYYQAVFTAYESQLINKFDMNPNINTIYDLATENDVSIQFITSLLPFLLLTFLFSGAMSVSTESIAGEKERGTIATLLMTPTKKSEIALGKIISLSLITMVSAASSFIGLMLSLPKLLGESSISVSMYSPTTYLLLFLVLISTVLIYVVVLSMISAYAKSIKEAASFAMPLMILNMLVGISSMLGVSSTKMSSYFVPVYNSVQSIIGILSLEVNPMNLIITFTVNLVVVGLGVYGLTKMFNSEKVMFNK